ncbi:DAK2 domain-containing protein [Streptomyces sp. NPDC051776]|uniref:DAK2 domain-containing protein n=1 Tax=Streptomyces sp. NPDC051776 TaxID=3155414 RepID=UPI00342A11EC
MPHTLDATTVRTWCGLALEALGQAREGIDAINVYPVADGDTGTNLYLTLESAAQAVDAVFAAHAAVADEKGPALPDAVRAMAHGALIGARGNSGTILAQLLRGMADVLAAEHGCTASGGPGSPGGGGPGGAEGPGGPHGADAAEALRRALRRAAESAYEAVAHPVEGTVLSVASAAADAAEHAEGGAVAVARAAYQGARTALDATPEQLDVLARAGVVDAGGSGLVTVLGSLVEAVSGETAMGPIAAAPSRHAATSSRPTSSRPATASARPPAAPSLRTAPTTGAPAQRRSTDDPAAVAAGEHRTAVASSPGAAVAAGRQPTGRSGAAVDGRTGDGPQAGAAGTTGIPGEGPASEATGGGPGDSPVRAGTAPRQAARDECETAGEDDCGPGAATPTTSPSATATAPPAGPRPTTVLPTAFHHPGAGRPAGDAQPAGEPRSGPAYEVIYLLEATDEAVAVLRSRLDALGDSLVVVGGDGLWNVHVHVDDAGAAVEAGVDAGRPYRIRITHFGAAAAAAESTPGAPGEEHERTERAGRVVVAVVPGEGLAGLCREAGATVVTARPGEPPASGELVQAIRRAHAREVVLLPNDPGLRHTAAAAVEQVRAEGVRVALIPTRSSVQGIAALAVHEPDRRFDEDVVAMTSAAGATRYAELAVAERQSFTTAGVCETGDVLGMIDGDVAVIGANLAGTAAVLLDRMLAAGGEMVTLVLGSGIPDDLGERLEAHVRESHLAVDTVVYRGGQPSVPLLIGVE